MQRRPRTPFRKDLPLIITLGVIWMALWQSFDLGTFIIGLGYATVIVRVFYLPPLSGSGRVNIFWAVIFTARFLVQMFIASFQVSWIAVTQGPRVRNSIISVQLRSHDDLMTTLTGHAIALVPGSLVLDIDRTTATLYLHALNVENAGTEEKITRDALITESLLIRAFGNRSDLAVVRAERRLGRTPGLSIEERARMLPTTVERTH